MQNDLFAKIDALIEMSKSTSNIDTLKAELTEINEEIETKQKDLEDQKKSMQDEKYVKASDRIIDENIKVSLELKIRKLENSQKELEKELKEILKQEDEMHQKQESLQEKERKLENLIGTLREKLEIVNDSDTEIKGYYQNLVAENEKKRNNTTSEIEAAENEYQKISSRLTKVTQELEDLKSKITIEKEKLRDTEANLSSNNAYIDYNLKKEDEQRLRDLEEKIDTLETRKEEIQNDAVMIGNEAKELLLEEDQTGCFLKVKELVNLLKKLPFMDIASSNELQSVLQEALEKAISERDEFASMIDNKKYDGNDAPIIRERVSHLEQRKLEMENDLNTLRDKINVIDTAKVRELSSLLSSATIVSENLKKELVEYNNVIEEAKDNVSPKKKAILVAAFNKKEEELKSVQNVIDAYEREMEELMKDSKRIAEADMSLIRSRIESINHDLKEIQKKAMINSKAKDILAVENDKAKLKELSDFVKDIMELKNLKQTPSEIYDEIEMSLGISISPEKSELVKPIIEEQSENSLNNFRITAEVDAPIELPRSDDNALKKVEQEKSFFNENVNISIEEPKQEKIEVNPISEIDSKPLESIVIADSMETPSPIKTSEITDIPEMEPVSIDELMPQEESSPTSEKIKVVNIEPLGETSTPNQTNEANNPIGDFKDEEYIDFDSLLDGGNV